MNHMWAERSRQAVWHPCSQMKQHEATPLLPIARGEGPWLIDYAGQRYLDALSSWWVNLFGHNHPRMKAALIDQLNQIEHVMLAGLTHAPVVELSERLTALTGLGHAFYASDGASATEIALKMSSHYWRNLGRADKNQFICLAGGYHGETVGALAVTDIPLFRQAYAPLIRNAHVLPSPDARLASVGQSSADYAQQCAQQLEHYLSQHHAHIAALIIEPLVQCAAGMAMYDASYLQRARQLCDQFQVHLIVDEIAVGFGRTGSLFAYQQAGIQPDFICLSKGLTGGYLPLSAVLTTDPIYQAFYDDHTARAFLHSHSYTGNPLACRAAVEVLNIFADNDILQHNQQLAERISQQAQTLSRHPRVRHARHLGMIWAFDIDSQLPDFSTRLYRAALQEGLILRPIGQTLYFMPPYVLDEAAIEHLIQGTERALDRVIKQEKA